MKHLAIVLLAVITGGCARTSSAPRDPADGPHASHESGSPDQPGQPGHHHAHHHGHGHAHMHDHAGRAAGSVRGNVVSHAGLPSFENNGNTLYGLATASMGAQFFEVWRSSIAVGSNTPPHRHQVEEIFVVLTGKGRVHIGDQVFEFEAPATIIAPANVTHQIFNTGNVPTDAIVVTGVGSKIWTSEGQEMNLPWRK